MVRILFFVLIPFCSYSQRVDTTVIIELQNQTADQLYSKVKQWTAVNFRDGKAVTQLDDKENHTIICKGNYEFNPDFLYQAYDGVYEFVLTIQTKDNKCRVTFDNINHVEFRNIYSGGNLNQEQPAVKSMPVKYWKKMKKDASSKISASLGSLTDFLLKPANDQW